MFKSLNEVCYQCEQLDSVVKDIRDKSVQCSNIATIEGDNRFWNIKEGYSSIFDDFKLLASDTYQRELGRSPKNIVLMVNHITADNSPDGSGGGWHVDSVRSQYKLFMYLTDCTKTENGPLTLFTSGSVWKDRLVIILNYLRRNKFRFTNEKISALSHKGFKLKPVLKEKCNPFFVNTSFIHRGAEITEGERVLVTAYMFDTELPPSIAKRVAG
ncbi:MULTISPECIES: hypothetical protein [unclassified Oleiphilus]|uniref:hypothetical protein n=1 Tax=unclassified Oleiphilus TaxID=2631174 RepID=UPI0007C34499|nr:MULTISPECIES: hypothetical protein [unclassified Oleiphilus]KZY35302.1 hypothetical protein A3729_17595 [Oleiphilus sp. HI0043]KZZ65407.1 hypothetical protein A3763_18525 [Oleiphilus sp. HI0128]